MKDKPDAVRHRYLMYLRNYYSVAELKRMTKYSESSVKGWLTKDRNSAKARFIPDRAIELLRFTVADKVLCEISQLKPEFQDFTSKH